LVTEPGELVVDLVIYPQRTQEETSYQLKFRLARPVAAACWEVDVAAAFAELAFVYRSEELAVMSLALVPWNSGADFESLANAKDGALRMGLIVEYRPEGFRRRQLLVRAAASASGEFTQESTMTEWISIEGARVAAVHSLLLHNLLLVLRSAN